MRRFTSASTKWTSNALAWVCMATVVWFAGYTQSEPDVTSGPQPLTRQAVSVVDGMILLDYSGPKGQVQKKDGTTDQYRPAEVPVRFERRKVNNIKANNRALICGTQYQFCDLPEFINAIQDPERPRGHARAYVQAFDGREWGNYTNGWVEASRPVYVIGSDRMGAMGPTLVPFLDMDAAKAFTDKHGGRILRFAKLTPEVMAEHARMSRDILRKGHMTGHMHDQNPSGHDDHTSGHGHRQ